MISSQQFQKNYPFLTCIKINDVEYVGIIINFDASIVSIYDISMLKTDLERSQFLDLGDVWWWESNRRIPINIFLKTEMQSFRNIIKTFNSRDIDILFGPVVSLSEIAEKRVKRKSIQLVRVPRDLQT